MQALVSPSLDSYADSPPTRHRVVVQNERIPRKSIQVLVVCVKTVRRKFLKVFVYCEGRPRQMERRRWRSSLASLINFKLPAKQIQIYIAFFPIKKKKEQLYF